MRLTSHLVYRRASYLGIRRKRCQRRKRRDARTNRQLLGSMPQLPNGNTLTLRSQSIKGNSSVGLGGKLWPAAAEICRWLCGQSLHGKCVFELGCGTGAVGLFAAALGASEVTLTDGGAAGVLDIARENLERNRSQLAHAECVRIISHRWGELEPTILPSQDMDLILASDCTYYWAARPT